MRKPFAVFLVILISIMINSCQGTRSEGKPEALTIGSPAVDFSTPIANNPQAGEVSLVETKPSVETIQIGWNEIYGDYLVGPGGMTVYIFYDDAPGLSNCYGRCAVNWPPLLLPNGHNLSAGYGVPGELGTILRQDGTRQITYNGYPLYYWKDDKYPGETNGQGIDEAWFIVTPVNKLTVSPTQ